MEVTRSEDNLAKRGCTSRELEGAMYGETKFKYVDYPVSCKMTNSKYCKYCNKSPATGV